MKRVLRWVGYGMAIVLALLLLFAGWVWFASDRAIGRNYEIRPERLQPATPEQLADGMRQARILGCFSCHGEGLSGNNLFDVPNVASVWASNLTEVAAQASDQQLAQGIRQGIGRDGRALWVMPSAMYSRLSDGEVAALIAVIRSQPRTGAATPSNNWEPLGRLAIALGNLRPAAEALEEFRVRQPYDAGPAFAAGRRLAANNCSECHGPDLTGGQPEPNIRAPGLSIAASYDRAQFRTLMRTGRPPGGRDLGLMSEVARNDFSHYNDAELDQLYDYLRARAGHVQDAPLEQ